ncbi:metallophosphoesterase [Frigoribacterium salinisoli]
MPTRTPTRTPRRRLVALVAATGALLAPVPAAFAATPAPAAAPAATAAPTAAAAPTPAPGAPGDASRFTLAVLPDTQFYSRYSSDQFVPRYGVDPFETQTAWLAEHADELGVPFVAHLGDVVDRAGTEREWVAADRAMANLEEAGLPYSVLPGNHDVLDSSDDLYDTSYDLAAEPFPRWFGPERVAQQTSLEKGSDPTGMNQFHVFEAEGQQFLVLALAWRASDETLAWADQVMADHPTLPTILTTHQLINVANDAVSPEDTDYGDRLWDQLISPNDQIFLTFNGHFHGTTRDTKVNAAGHEVTQVLMDHQMAYEGGNGYLGLVEFDLTNDRIDVQTASPWVTSKPQESLTSFDQPFLEGPQQQFTLELDFAERFAAFDPDFGPGQEVRGSLGQAARDLLLDGFEGAPPATTEAPGSTADYARVDGTLAHWRPEAAQGVVAEGEAVVDVVAGADLRRATLAESGSTTARVDDVVVSADAAPLSSAGAGMCFVDSDKREGRFSYLTTSGDTAVDRARFEDGYTIETFLKVDAGWTEDANSWAKAIVRSGNRSQIGVPETRWDWTASPAALGLSNLRELQWTEVPTDATKGDRTAWSGEIVFDRWMHVALVNDPASSTTTMYVDGAPVLRNTTDTAGQSIQEGMPWLFGSDWVDDRGTNGWAGCIGETRVIDHPTAAAEWLTARADLTGLTAVADDASAGGTTTVTGTGFAGASVTLAGAVSGTTVVAEDGTWAVDVSAPAAAGTLSATATQALGTRAAEPVGFDVVTAAVEVPGEPEVPGDPGTPGEPGAGAPGAGAPGAGDGAGAPGAGAGAGAGAPGAGAGAGTGPAGSTPEPVASADGELAFTGPWSVLAGGAAAALLLAAGLGAVLLRRRQAAQE